MSASVREIFLEFLIIGASSFGGVVPYLRGNLVTKRQWIDDKEFVETLSISQSLPGLNAANMAILVGEKLRGWLGSAVAIVGICLPGGALMYAVGVFYHLHGDHPWAPGCVEGSRRCGSRADLVHRRGTEQGSTLSQVRFRIHGSDSRSTGYTGQSLGL